MKPATTYGIHSLKTLALLFQIEVHAYNWMVIRLNQANLAGSLSTTELKILLLKGGLSMSVPMTAAAVLRLSLPISETGYHLPVGFRVQPYIWVAVYLGLIESLKQWIVYRGPEFFQWDALHLIAISLVAIVLMARKSILWLWPVAAVLTFSAPLLIPVLTPLEKSFETQIPLDWIPPIGWAFTLTFLALAGGAAVQLWKSHAFTKKYKKRIFAVGAAACVVVSSLFFRMHDGGFTKVVLRELPFGILMGSESGLHIWGILPWGGLTIFGFLIYDLLVRFRASKGFLISLTGVGLGLLVIFFWFFSDQTLANCSAQLSYSSFNSLCFNRTPVQLFLSLGLFLLMTPVSVLMYSHGLENKYVQAFSRSILWIYIYETSVLYFLAPYWLQQVPLQFAFPTYILFSVATCFALALLIDRFKFRLNLTLRRKEARE